MKKYRTLWLWILTNVVTVLFVVFVVNNLSVITTYINNSPDTGGFLTRRMLLSILLFIMVSATNSLAIINALIISALNYFLDKQKLRFSNAFSLSLLIVAITLFVNFVIMLFINVDTIEQLRAFALFPTNIIISFIVMYISRFVSTKIAIIFTILVTVPSIIQLIIL
jgi:hypothetical protein